MPDPIGGLQTTPNSLQLQQGVLTEAKDVVIDIGGYIRSREGVSIYATCSENSSINKIFQFNGKLGIAYDNGKIYTEASAGGKVFSLITSSALYDATYEMPLIKTQGISILGLLHPNYATIASDTGIGGYKLFSDGTFSPAGVTHPIVLQTKYNTDAAPNLPSDGTSSTSSSVTYIHSFRFTISYKDIMGRLVESKPTGIVYYGRVNDSHIVSAIAFKLASSANNFVLSDTLNLYGGSTFLTTTGTVPSPNDTMKLIKKLPYPVTNEQCEAIISNLMEYNGEFLYTNSNQEGAEQENESIPLHLCSSQFGNYSLYANCIIKKFLIVDLNLDSTTRVNQTITIDSYSNSTNARSVWANDSKNNIPNLAGDVGNYINTFFAEFAYHYNKLLSFGTTNAVYQIQRKNFNTSAMTLTTNTASAINNYPVGGIVGDNNIFPNRIYYSKSREPEHVPSGNYFEVGINTPILSIQQLRTYALVFKPEGTYILNGDNPSNFEISFIYPELAPKTLDPSVSSKFV